MDIQTPLTALLKHRIFDSVLVALVFFFFVELDMRSLKPYFQIT